MRKTLPIETVECAVRGDVEAIECVLTHYAAYVNYLASRFGYLDTEAQCRLESKLLYAIFKFRLDY